MRVISGKYKGRKILGFNIDGTRPTMDRVKESLFGMIQFKIKESVVLDLFSGSGSLGIECISNGSNSIYLVDNNKIAIDTIKKNIENMNENIYIIKRDYLDALNYFKEKNIKFDIIFLDPPYKLNLIQKSLDKILEYNLLNKNAIVVCEYENEDFTTSLNLIKLKKYSNKNIAIYENKK